MDPKYKRMITRMREKEKAKKRRRCGEKWFLYILRCCDHSLYTGITKDLTRRLKIHNEGRASRYTRVRRPVELLYQEPCGTRAQALIRECEVKAYSKKKKENMIAGIETRIKRKQRQNV